MNWLVKINEYLNRSDFLDSVVQVLLSTVFIFVPFALMAFVGLNSEEYDSKAHEALFISFFSRGELGIPIFGITGTLLFLLFRKVSPMGVIASLFSAIAFIVVFLIVAFLIGSNPGFGETLPIYKRDAITACFIVVNLLWIYVLWRSKRTPPPSLPPPDKELENARKLAAKARNQT